MVNKTATLIDKEKVVDEYEKRSEAIIDKLFTILTRAQRKVDDVAYRKTLQKFK